jgi:hydrogenase-4 component B
MNAEALFLSGDAALLGLAVAGGFAARKPFAGTLVYGGALAICAAMLVLALVVLLGRAGGQALVLPLGLPWIGARFRLDALSAFFLVVVNLGGAAASL